MHVMYGLQTEILFSISVVFCHFNDVASEMFMCSWSVKANLVMKTLPLFLKKKIISDGDDEVLR